MIRRVALAQMRSGITPADNVATIAAFAREATTAGAQLLATPEMSLRLDRDRERFRAGLETGMEKEALARIAAIACENGLFLLLGSAAMAGSAPGKAVNRSFLFGPDGRIEATYDKIHLFDVDLPGGQSWRESATYEAGAAACVCAAAGAHLGLTICYDLRFPALYRALAQAGAWAIFVPSAFTRPTGEAHWEILLRARAIETGAYILAPAQGGLHEDGRETFGRTMAVDPWGRVIGRLDHDAPGLLVVDIDTERSREARAAIPAYRTGGSFMPPMIADHGGNSIAGSG